MLYKCTNCFKSLGITSRMEIYDFLDHANKSTVSDIVSHVHVNQPTVSYHLNKMYENGLVQKEKQGKEVYYSLNPQCPIDQTTCAAYQLTTHYAPHQ